MPQRHSLACWCRLVALCRCRACTVWVGVILSPKDNIDTLKGNVIIPLIYLGLLSVVVYLANVAQVVFDVVQVNVLAQRTVGGATFSEVYLELLSNFLVLV